MDVLLDTNLLLRCIQPDHPLHRAAVDGLAELVARKDRLCVVPQVVYEFFVVCTRPPGEYGGLGMTNSAALSEIHRVSALFELLDDSAEIYPEWLRLIEERGVIGKRSHDTRLAAAMNMHGIAVIATFNVKDFQRYAGLSTLDPNLLAFDFANRAPR